MSPHWSLRSNQDRRRHWARCRGWRTNGRRKRSRLNLRFGQEEFAPIEVLVRGELSPEQIVGRRKREGAKVMSHETIYKWIWADKRRGGTLWKHLRGAQKRRRKRFRNHDSRGRLAGKTMIQQRPAVVESRKRIGDWEIDTVHGRGKACVLTVVERKSGIVRIGKIHRATKEQTLGRTVSLLRDKKEHHRGQRLRVPQRQGAGKHPENQGVFRHAPPCLGERNQREHKRTYPAVSSQGNGPESGYTRPVQSHCREVK